MKAAAEKINPEAYILSVFSPKDRLEASFKIAKGAFKKTKLNMKDIETSFKSIYRLLTMDALRSKIEVKNILQKKGANIITLIIMVIIIAVVTIFSIQNAIPVVISFFSWKFEASLAIVLFLTGLADAIIGVSAASLFRMKLFKKE